MKINELRIGNLLFLPQIGKMAGVVEIRNGYLRCAFYRDDIKQLHQSLINFIEFSPMTIDDKILSDMGFHFKKQGYCGQDNWAGYDFYTNEKITLMGNIKKFPFLILDGYYNCQFRYVHELQNIYFAITGEELTIATNGC